MGFIFSRGVPEGIKEQEEVKAHEVFSTMASRASVLFEAMHSTADGYVVKVFDEMWDASKTIVVGFDKSLHSDWDGHYWASWLPCAASDAKLHMQKARQRLSALAAKLGWQYNELVGGKQGQLHGGRQQGDLLEVALVVSISSSTL